MSPDLYFTCSVQGEPVPSWYCGITSTWEPTTGLGANGGLSGMTSRLSAGLHGPLVSSVEVAFLARVFVSLASSVPQTARPIVLLGNSVELSFGVSSGESTSVVVPLPLVSPLAVAGIPAVRAHLEPTS
jgi:hypothetical protein